MRSVLLFCAFLSVSLLSGVLGSVLEHGHQIPELQRLPFCEPIVGKLSHLHQETLRDGIQTYQHMTRRSRELQQIIHYKRNPPQKIEEQYAWKTSESIENLEKMLEAADKIKTTMYTKLYGELDKLQKEGALPQGADLTGVSACIMGRLNTHLFPYQPVVSFMLQYFKRPWMINKIVESLRGCNQVGLICMQSAYLMVAWLACLDQQARYLALPKSEHRIRSMHRRVCWLKEHTMA